MTLPPKYIPRCSQPALAVVESTITIDRLTDQCGPHRPTVAEWLAQNAVHPDGAGNYPASLVARILSEWYPSNGQTTPTALVTILDIAKAANVSKGTVQLWIAREGIAPESMGGETKKLKLFAPIVLKWFMDRKSKQE